MEDTMQTQNQQTENSNNSVPVVQLLQKDAVYMYLSDALRGTGINFTQLKESKKAPEVKVLLKGVRQRLFEGIRNGEIKCKTMDDSKLKKYCSGLINNWLNKDPRYVV